MTSITLPKTQYDILKRRAVLYEKILRSLPERKWGIEEYTSERVREFMREDKIGAVVRTRAKKMLSKPK